MGFGDDVSDRVDDGEQQRAARFARAPGRM
jgi:hypothetical protein